jgi:hypothetical protein
VIARKTSPAPRASSFNWRTIVLWLALLAVILLVWQFSRFEKGRESPGRPNKGYLDSSVK